jgi:translation initiation factor 2B subunit (eIF-2B alpha/beta/delta family)
MGNVIKYIRQLISKISPDLSEADAKKSLLNEIHIFIENKLIYARESISRYVTSVIKDDDVILTFGSSPLIRKILLSASQTRKFRLILIDTRPLNEGLTTIKALSSSNLHCTYSPLSATPVLLKDCTKVLLGASCLLSNGSMLAPAGTAMVAALAKQHQIPVIVASESYKFSDKVQLDSIVFNELGHASEIVSVTPSSGAASSSSLDNEAYSTTFQATPNDSYLISPQRVDGIYRGSADKVKNPTSTASSNDNSQEKELDNSDYIQIPALKHMNLSNIKLPFEVVNLRYDLTSLNNISVIATETGLIPPTSIPVLLREMQNDSSR